MIVDPSAPNGASVNDGIGADVCSLTYASVDNAVSIIQHLGQGTQLVKMDFKDVCFSGQCSLDHKAPGPGNTAG